MFPLTGEKRISYFLCRQKVPKSDARGPAVAAPPGSWPPRGSPVDELLRKYSRRIGLHWLIWRQYIRRRLSMGGHGGPRPKRSEPLRAPRADFWFFCSATKEHQRPPAASYGGTHLKPLFFYKKEKGLSPPLHKKGTGQNGPPRKMVFAVCQKQTQADYCSSCRTPCGTWLACASMACADWIRMLFLV